jgi:uncharacterized membrane protein YdbT with pleckstrin-like domain
MTTVDGVMVGDLAGHDRQMAHAANRERHRGNVLLACLIIVIVLAVILVPVAYYVGYHFGIAAELHCASSLGLSC